MCIELNVNGLQDVRMDQEATESSVQLCGSHPTLEELSLVYNEAHRFLICEDCRVVVEATAVKAHLKSSHPGCQMRVDAEALQAALYECGIQHGWPHLTSQDGPVPVLGGLEVYNAMRCLRCPTVCGTVSSLRSHQGLVHGSWSRDPCWEACKAQRLAKAGNHGWEWIEVTLGAADEEARSKPAVVAPDLAAVYKMMEKGPGGEQIARNAREVSPWLLSTGWHLHTERFDAYELRTLVAPPGTDEFSGLVIAVQEYVEHALDLISCTDVLTLQILNTEDPMKR